MSFSNAAENAILLHLFQNLDYANIGDVTGLRSSTAAGVFYVGLHTADPGEAGTQSTSEIAYTGYARVSVARTSGGWTVSGNTVSNTAAVNFPACTAGSGTATHFSIGTNASGAGNLLLSGALTGSLAISAGITPAFSASQLQASLD